MVSESRLKRLEAAFPRAEALAREREAKSDAEMIRLLKNWPRSLIRRSPEAVGALTEGRDEAVIEQCRDLHSRVLARELSAKFMEIIPHLPDECLAALTAVNLRREHAIAVNSAEPGKHISGTFHKPAQPLAIGKRHPPTAPGPRKVGNLEWGGSQVADPQPNA
jgi:hypothetical protein